MQKMEKFLEFNGKRITVLLADGTWWVAIRPICDALNVDYHSQYKNIQEDEILSRVLSKQTTHDASNRLQEMSCLPEMYVYGWLFMIRSSSPDLVKYKKVCYEVLFNHFHGAITGRLNTLSEKSETEVKTMELQKRLEEKMKDMDEYKELQLLKGKKKEIAKKLNELDAELLSGQLIISFPEQEQ